MADQTFDDLRRSLLESGVAPRHVRRLVLELHDHCDDLRREALSAGCDPAAATARAVRRLGDQQVLARKMVNIPELRTWAYRYPRLARVYYPIAYAMLLPAAPLFAGMAQPSLVARWGTALLLSATVTAAMFLGMQLAIALG